MRKEPYKVKLTPYRKNFGEILHRQSKNGNNFSSDGRYQFIMDDELDEADFWVIHGKGVEKLHTARSLPKTLFCLLQSPTLSLPTPKATPSSLEWYTPAKKRRNIKM